MNRNSLKMSVFPLIAILLTGCATTRARRTQSPEAEQIAALQSQLQAKDQEIQELQTQLESRRPASSNNFAAPAASSDKFHLLRVAGVTPLDVQTALLKAGFDPGPLDGRLGKKTRTAIKEFQKKNGLATDGVVGERTWAALK